MYNSMSSVTHYAHKNKHKPFQATVEEKTFKIIKFSRLFLEILTGYFGQNVKHKVKNSHLLPVIHMGSE